MRTSQLAMKALADKAGKAAYEKFDENERRAVSFGMFPHFKMKDAEVEFMAAVKEAGLEEDYRSGDSARLLAVAIMDAAGVK